MVLQNSTEDAASPTPSVESLSEASTVGSFQDPSDSIDSNSIDKPNSSAGSSTTSSGLDMSPLDCVGGTKCPVCGSTFSNPKVLLCFHTFCGDCLKKIVDENEAIVCPQCHSETKLGPSGIDGLLCDFGVTGLIDTFVSGCADYQSTSCTSCKSQETHAVARCLTCSNFLCPSCVMAHQFMHCFEGHCVTTLGEITSKEGSRHGIQELESINRLVQEGKVKASEIQMNLKNLETSLTRLSDQYDNVQGDITETFKFYTMNLEERKAELLKELEARYTAKQFAISEYSHKAQEIVDKLSQGTDFIERLMKNASNGEVLLFKKTLEQEFGSLLENTPEVNLDDVCDFKFCFNNEAIQQSVKATFGFIRPMQDESMQTKSGSKQPPISRPTVSTNAPTMGNDNQLFKLSNCPFSNHKSNLISSSTADNNIYNNTSCHNALTSGLVQSIASLAKGSGVTCSSSYTGGLGNPGQKSFCERQELPYTQTSGLISPLSNLYVGNSHVQSLSGSDSNSYEHINKRLAASSQFGRLLGNMESLGSSNVNGLNPWATVANEKMHFNGFNGDSRQQFGLLSSSRCSSVNGSNTPDSMLDLSSKLLASQQQQPLFPPKSQIKRQKMIYHCKFGEFGILGGQFTEPSGVAVNAQNDIIVADTNNHRVQIFDKEGRFKFQFGECGKKDGQLLYPNRVAVVKNSGDIIVTERSPTHQVQIYNQYGQFVRKFGANILQHPRGVCVDNKGRIIIVECKVMRVIIFDQMGNVLNKFGCSKHLEFPNGVMVNDRQEIFISDNRAHCVKVFNYDGVYLRQIGGEGITNYPIGVGINSAGEIAIADNHNNFNLTIFSQDGQVLSALESKVKHAQCFDVALMDDGSVVLASKDYRIYNYRYIQQPQVGMMTPHPMLASHQMSSHPMSTHQFASIFNA